MMFSFSQSQRERIEVDVLCCECEPVGDHYNDNWLTLQVRVCVGGFHGNDAAIFRNELAAFLTQLRPLYDTLRGTAEFATLEGQLHLWLTGDGNGHIELKGEVADQPDIGNRLHFTLHFDQSQLGASIRELKKVTLEFPVRAA